MLDSRVFSIKRTNPLQPLDIERVLIYTHIVCALSIDRWTDAVVAQIRLNNYMLVRFVLCVREQSVSSVGSFHIVFEADALN